MNMKDGRLPNVDSSCIPYNVHGLVDLGDEVKCFGQLDSISSFPHENYLDKISFHGLTHSFAARGR